MTRRRLLLAVAATPLALLPATAHADKLSQEQHAKLEAKQRESVAKLRKQIKAARDTLKLSASQKSAGQGLSDKLTDKQRTALRRLGGVLLEDARAAAKSNKSTFAVDRERLKPHVVGTGSKEVAPLFAATMTTVADQSESEPWAAADALENNLDQRTALRADIVVLRKIIEVGRFPVTFTYSYPKKTTVELASKSQAVGLLEELEKHLEALTTTSVQALQPGLEGAASQQQQALTILSNLSTTIHDTIKAILDNLKASVGAPG